ncbi:hypothetical protein SD457_12770 [Coprobacillaceae bacterium CR2/5/TPMF4]|nr:hypothetical protein SD457_12770 [Coprobacillaceae bacterium CR2/5/TPMF4]
MYKSKTMIIYIANRIEKIITEKDCEYLMNIKFLKKIINERNISIYRLSKLTKLRDSGLGMIINEREKILEFQPLLK